MKIAILTYMFPPRWLGGTEIVTQNIARHLAKAGHDVHIITSFEDGLLKESKEDNFFVHRVYYPKIKFLGTPFFWIKSFFALKKIKPDIIHCQTIQMGIPGFLFQKFYKKPYIVWCHGLDIHSPWKFKKTISRIVLNSADAVIALTNNMKDEVQKFCKRNIFVLPNGINLGKFNGFSKNLLRKKIEINDDEKIIVFVGGLKPVKGIKYLIEAFKIISQKISGARLFLVGSGPERQRLEDIVKKNGLEKQVNFIGKVENDDVPKYMLISDIFVLPSLSEGFPLVIIEAMASGLPIVATKVRGLPEIVKDSENGFLVEPENPEQIAEKVLLLLENDNLREKMSNNNKGKAKEYSWENIVEKIEKIYSEVIDKNN